MLVKVLMSSLKQWHLCGAECTVTGHTTHWGFGLLLAAGPASVTPRWREDLSALA